MWGINKGHLFDFKYSKTITVCPALIRPPSKNSRPARETQASSHIGTLVTFIQILLKIASLNNRLGSLWFLTLTFFHQQGLQSWIMCLDSCLSSCHWLVLTLPGKTPTRLFQETKIHYIHPYWFSLSFAYRNAFPSLSWSSSIPITGSSALPSSPPPGPEGLDDALRSRDREARAACPSSVLQECACWWPHSNVAPGCATW